MKIVFLAHNCNVSFIETELNYLLKSNLVEKISICTDSPIESKTITGNPKTNVILYGLYKPQSNFIVKWNSVCSIGFRELFRNGFKYRGLSAKKNLFRTVKNEVNKALIVKAIPADIQTVYISFWAGDEALILSMLKRWGLTRKILTRMHAYDVYEEFDNNGAIPFRWFVLRYMDYFITISIDAQKYLERKYPQLRDKIKTFYLGSTAPIGEINTAPQDVIRIVSCGWVYKHKNVLEVFQVLNTMDNVEWYHIGNGDAFEELKSEVNKSSRIKVNLLGSLPQNEIFNLYKTVEFTCLLSLSTTEGIPVSMMEAISFGIPIIATDVGGCREIVDETTGYLLSQEYTFDEIKNKILECKMGVLSTKDGRKAIRKQWENKFDAERNHSKFIEMLQNVAADNN